MRTFRNGNQYKGTFVNNQMHTIDDERNRGKFSFYDASNDMVYEDYLEIEEGQLIKAKTVRNQRTGKKIGCFICQQIVREDDERYDGIVRNWDEPNVHKFVEF